MKATAFLVDWYPSKPVPRCTGMRLNGLGGFILIWGLLNPFTGIVPRTYIMYCVHYCHYKKKWGGTYPSRQGCVPSQLHHNEEEGTTLFVSGGGWQAEPHHLRNRVQMLDFEVGLVDGRRAWWWAESVVKLNPDIQTLCPEDVLRPPRYNVHMHSIYNEKYNVSISFSAGSQYCHRCGLCDIKQWLLLRQSSLLGDHRYPRNEWFR